MLKGIERHEKLQWTGLNRGRIIFALNDSLLWKENGEPSFARELGLLSEDSIWG